MSLIDGRAASATVSATEDSIIALISKKDFYALLHAQEKILFNLLRVFCQRLRTSNETIGILNHASALQRIKMLFLMLSNKHGKESGDGVMLSIQITHRDIASMTGLTRETVTKIMNELRGSGCITVLESKFIRLNPSFYRPEEF